MVYLERADSLTFDEKRIADAQILHGNVRFRHEDALMYCDSAYFYEKTNSLDAFGHVRFVQGDTLFGYCDKLFYDGNTKFARMRRHVRLVDKSTTLTTDTLNYDRERDFAWYYTGGTIQDSLNTLTSRWGQYISHLDQALFKTDVHLVNERFVMDADTLKYNTKTHISDLVGPTTILYEEETTILSTLGWYNTETEKSMLLNRSRIIHDDGKQMTADTIFYDKKMGFGQCFSNMEMRDTVQQAVLTGMYGEIYEDHNRGFVTDSALLIDYSQSDPTYIHADTLFTIDIDYQAFNLQPRDSVLRITTRDSITWDSTLVYQAPDTIWYDTAYSQLSGHDGVRVYRQDLQALCRAMIYNTRDSLLSLYDHPIIWNEDNQISADFIEIFMRDSTVDHLHGTGNAIAIKQETTDYFNQLAGKEIFAYLTDGEIRKIQVDGNAETIFFPADEANPGEYLGVNQSQSSYVTMYLQEKKIERVIIYPSPTGTFYPLKEVNDSNSRLASFHWDDKRRPLTPDDVFHERSSLPAPPPPNDSLERLESPTIDNAPNHPQEVTINQ